MNAAAGATDSGSAADLALAIELVAAMRSGAPVSPSVVNSYYTLCIPFYREFLGDHWHTGYYSPEGAIGPADQLRMEQVVASSAGLTQGCEVLDVGCGVGGPACHLARWTGARFRGLTPNTAQRQIARESALKQKLTHQVSFDEGYAGALPYPDGSFDAVLFFESPCHFPDRAQFFSEAWRVLKPAGRLAGQDWLASESPGANAWATRICSTWAIPALGTVSSYAALMTDAGFNLGLACDMREEMALLRGFMTDPADRREVEAEMAQNRDPIRRMIMEGLLVLGAAAQAGAFTVGRFLATKPLLV
jgi:cyclopropane fatty-acyl-phospholipid synthase-like methyltransferase